MLTATIKNVDDDAWRILKVEAAKHDMTMGQFISKLIKEHATDELAKQREYREALAATMDAIRQKGGKFNASAIIRKWRDTRYAGPSSTRASS